MNRGHEDCSGCGICTMVCPVWWETGDVWMTPHGRARALQGGASVDELADSVMSCRMCGACEPACPERIDILAMVRGLREQLYEKNHRPFAEPPAVLRATSGPARRLLLAGPDLEQRPAVLDSVIACLGGPDRIQLSSDDGRDLAWALESGAPIDGDRVDRFLTAFGQTRELVVIEGILHRLLRERCPRIRVRGLAETLLDQESVLSALGPKDFLVIDARAYHSDHARLVELFARLRSRTGCQMNLDLQRFAIPTVADSLQARMQGHESCETSIGWMLEGRDVDRIVVESALDLDAVAAWTDVPVTHLSVLASAAQDR